MAGFYDDMAAGAERLLEDPDAVEAVHDLACLNVAENIGSVAFRLTYVAMTAADGDKTISDAVAQSLRGSSRPGRRSMPPSWRPGACSCGRDHHR